MRLNEDLHISEQELLLVADGELQGRHAARVKAHLAACWNCRARMAELEDTIVDFTRAYRQTHVHELPPIAGPRALLRSQLAQLASQPGPAVSHWPIRSTAVRTAAASVAFLAIALVGTAIFRTSNLQRTARATPSLESERNLPERGAVPDPRLTPGVVREATMNDLCAVAHEEVVGQVTSSMRQEVLHEYGIAPSRAGEYEIDYLIAPGLGGTEDLHNLWPQPYASSLWNAYAKDDLEERLHQLVCARQIELPEAQRDIAHNWIEAYKKYFHTNQPPPLHADLDPLSIPTR